MQYWIHRISHHIELSGPLLSRNLLSIGWSDFAKREFINEHQNNWQRVPQTVEQRCGKVKSRLCLQRFLEMKIGDRVVVPRPYVFHVYEIETDERLIPVDINVSDLKNWHGASVKINQGQFYEEGKDKPIDLGFFRMVSPLALDIPRASYADNALTKRMKVRQTNVNIYDLRDNVEEAMTGFLEKKPINPHGLIVEKCAGKILEIIQTKLDSNRFEKLIKWYFQKMGAKADMPAKRKKGAQEGDADIVATFEAIKTIIYVQAKQHDSETKTNKWAVEQVKSYIESNEAMGSDDGYSKIAWVVSTANKFDEKCKKLAEENKIHLINGKEFAAMLLEAGISSLEELA